MLTITSEKCKQFLQAVSEDDTFQLQKLNQKSKLWLHQWNIRLTSNFGKIIKSASDKTQTSIVISLLYKATLHTEAVLHMHKYEYETLSKQHPHEIHLLLTTNQTDAIMHCENQT